jgi:acyl carrier protein
MTDINQKITNILSDKFGVAPNLITPIANLIDDLNLSEMEIMDLITALEQECDFLVPEEFDINDIKTITDLEELVEQQSDEL